MNCFSLRPSTRTTFHSHATLPEDTITASQVSDAAGTAETGMPASRDVYAVGMGQWKTPHQPSQPALLGGHSTPGVPVNVLPAPAVLIAPQPTLLQQLAQLPAGTKTVLATAAVAGVTLLGVTAGFLTAGLSSQSTARPPSPCVPGSHIACEDAGPQPPEAPSPIDALLPTLFNATEAAFAHCFGNGTVPELAPGVPAPIEHYTTAVVYQAALPLAQAGQGSVTQAIDQLSCPPLDETGPVKQSLSIISASFAEQLLRLLPPMLPAPVLAPSPAPHTGASARVAADVVGTMALTVALHTLGLF